MTIQPGTDIGRYHILEQLGEGGMAIVYKAYDTRLENEVAIKVIRTERLIPEYRDRTLKRFQIEARKMAQLTHPNIVPVMDYGEFEGSPYIIMRYLPGGTLKEMLDQPLSASTAAEILLPVADALGYAHEKGLVHRDIKPSNILITESGKPMLSDFGVAKVLDNEETRDLTMTGMGVGTPEYMAPEMGTSRDFDHRADIYALGIVLYEMVTGRKPYVADTPIAVLLKHSSDPLPRPTQFNADIPEAFERVLFKALAKDPDARYQTMAELAGALKPFAGESRAAVKTAPTKPTRTPERIVPEEAPRAEKKQARVKKPFDARWLYGALGALGLGLVIYAGIKIAGDGGEEAALPTETAVPLDTATPISTATTAWTPTPALGIGSTMVSDIDGMTMVYVPEDEFTMGSEDGDSDESPVHTVFLDAFWIDQTEVTNAQFAEFLNENGNLKEGGAMWFDSASSYARIGLVDDIWQADDGYADHPAVEVSWYGANAYCQWAGRELPTEAQWEKAARGTDGRTYPWGEGIDCSRANYRGCGDFSRSSPVGYFGDSGVSPYGAYDMAGNVWEWVADWYDEDYYRTSPGSNPTGPSEGSRRVLRGGSWGGNEWSARSANRYFNSPYYSSDFYGFRCARLP